MSTCLVKCTCAHPFQDRIYKGRKVANYTAKGEARCTVCSATHRNVPPIHVAKKKTGTGGGRSYIARPPVEGWLGGLPEKNGWRPGGK